MIILDHNISYPWDVLNDHDVPVRYFDITRATRLQGVLGSGRPLFSSSSDWDCQAVRPSGVTVGFAMGFAMGFSFHGINPIIL